MIEVLDNTNDTVAPEVEASIKRWTIAIRKGKKKWHADFCRMRDNMRFAKGLQWEGQATTDDDRYSLNLLTRIIGQKVASLYARNPRVSAKRRDRMDFAVWDQKLETLQTAILRASDDPNDVESAAIIADYEHGRSVRDLIDRLGRTLELVYQWNIDRQEPEFKRQLKQLVRRVCVCGVGYVRLDFSRTNNLPSSTTNVTVLERMKRVADLSRRFTEGELQDDAPEMEELRSLVSTINYDQGDVAEEVMERLVFEFPPATSIIPDPETRALNGFVGAWWIAQEFMMRVSAVNEFFGVNISRDSKLITYDDQFSVQDETNPPSPECEDPYVCVWEVFDRRTRSTFTICNGWRDYLRPPTPLVPVTKRFWPIYELTFNDVETEDDGKMTIFPPSDVDIVKSSQKEWNRAREALRKHRAANRPKYLTMEGWLDDKDKDSFEVVPDSGIIALRSLPQGITPDKALVPMLHAPIDSALYDTTPLQQDILLGVGVQEANIGPLSGATATEAGIAEQSRTTATASNIDDLDDFLSSLARGGGEIVLREFSEDTVKLIAGDGAVWPEDPTQFVNEVHLEIVAASSGRPNKALEIANFERIAPLLIQAGANPQFLIREGLKRLDERIDPTEAFAITPPAAASTQAPTQTSTQAPMQLVGAA